MSKIYDFLVVGGGIAGLNIAKRLTSMGSVLLIDKDHCGSHASGKCSGVVHAGVFYSKNSLKSKFCIKGNQSLSQYCQERNLPFKNIGKIISMTNFGQAKLLQDIYLNAKDNQSNVQLIDYQQAKEIEPRIKQFDSYIWSPDTSIADPPSIIQSLKKDVLDSKGEIKENTKYQKLIHSKQSETKIRTTQGDFICKYLVSSAGLYADQIANDFGFGKDVKVLPFRGMYIYSKKGLKGYNTLVYPVVDFTAHAFLGIHTTEDTAGNSSIGPTAIPAL